MTSLDVIARRHVISCEQGDCLEWGAALPDDSIDLLFTSPPYLLARTYGRGDVARGLDEWVEWMMRFVRVFSPKVKGLIAINCEGQTRDYKYAPAPFLLMADLHRAGFNLRKPPIFHRVGIPGSGGPDWLRNDYEPIICVTRPGELPWSDNIACGKPPKYEQGGAMSNRTVEGTRVNDGVTAGRISKIGAAGQPGIANPGNVIHCNVGGGHLGHPYAHENEAPFPLPLAEFFVKSFCPPGGLVCDPFMGSSTTGHACLEHGRRYIGCDLRESQVELSMKRLLSVTPAMPTFEDEV